ncbi:MAG: argF [Solirubrobacterales bacterium]|nr:argF [Solirubrobacterales bacterium]
MSVATTELTGRHFLKEIDFTRPELLHLVDLAAELKAAKRAGTETPRLAGREIALIFEKSSTRTRCAFEVGAFDQGAHVTYLDPTGSQLGHKESIADTAQVLGRMFDAIEYRGTAQSDVETLARHAGVPVYNGLSSEWHPTQMLADLLTMREHTGKPFDELAYAFVGDGRYNMGRSLLVTGAIMGCDVRLITPPQLRPPQDVIALAHELAAASGARITISDDVADVRGVDVVHTDVWVSMGESHDVWLQRATLLTPYQVNAALMARTGNPDVAFMHCLPAFHDTQTVIGREIAAATGISGGLEVTDEVFRSPASIVFDQAENRLHTIKAVLVATLS